MCATCGTPTTWTPISRSKRLSVGQRLHPYSFMVFNQGGLGAVGLKGGGEGGALCEVCVCQCVGVCSVRCLAQTRVVPAPDYPNYQPGANAHAPCTTMAFLAKERTMPF